VGSTEHSSTCQGLLDHWLCFPKQQSILQECSNATVVLIDSEIGVLEGFCVSEINRIRLSVVSVVVEYRGDTPGEGPQFDEPFLRIRFKLKLFALKSVFKPHYVNMP
jgi:hypothetical protein